MGHPSDGILLVDKAGGETSFDVIRRIRHILPGRKIGHAGTLDPLATGLLIILLGQGTKLCQWIMLHEKVYEGVLKLGVETDTLDSTGKITAEYPVPSLTLEELASAGRQLTGKIEQKPPRFSAVKVAGQRAYRLARKGTAFDLPKRQVFVRSLKILSMDLPQVTIRVRCSAGTYVRSLFADLGRKVGTGAHMTALRRKASGQFFVENAITSESLCRELNTAVLEGEVIPLSRALPDMMELKVNGVLARKIRQGYRPAGEELLSGDRRWNGVSEHVKITKDEELIAVARIYDAKTKGMTTRLLRVFH
jgi:tRNA pseudouridine55 synthase